jgi:hypothetical protein
MSDKPLSQQQVRNITGTSYDYNGDWLALFAQNGITTGTWGERFKRWDDARMTPLSTTTISSPVNYVDVDLPSGFSAFHLYLVGVENTRLSFAFSQDDGATWISNRSTDADAYSYMFTYQALSATYSESFPDGSMYVPQFGDGNVCASLVITPGDASHDAIVIGTFASDNGGAASAFWGIYRAACVTNTARVNVVRFWEGGEDADEINPIKTLASGTFSLYGVL